MNIEKLSILHNISNYLSLNMTDSKVMIFKRDLMYLDAAKSSWPEIAFAFKRNVGPLPLYNIYTI